MSPFIVRCFKQGSPKPTNAFFILSKGINTGRPSWEPCPNCFVLTCSDHTELNNYFWLVYSLWAGGKFRLYLVGSVIEFIHLRDLKCLIQDMASKVTDVNKIGSTMQHLLQLEINLQNQLQLIRKAKQAVVSHCIK
jgi:hypothetical protein